MRHIRLVTGILTVTLLVGLAVPAAADQTFWTVKTAPAPKVAPPVDPAANLGGIYYYGCGNGGGGGRGNGIAQQEQPRPYGFGFAPERNPGPPVRQTGYPQYPHSLVPTNGRGGNRGNYSSSGCGGNYGYNGSGGHRRHKGNPVGSPRRYPQQQRQSMPPRPVHT